MTTAHNHVLGQIGRITLQFDTFAEGYQHYGAIITPGGRFLSDCAPTAPKLRATLLAKIHDTIERADRADQNRKRRLLLCADGTALLIEYREDAWGYAITGPDRKYASGSSMGGTMQDFDSTLAAARRHADSGYGGVVHEMPL